jgi:putative transcriptional regulator
VKPVDSVQRGSFLVASPLLRDPNFVHTVVLMCEHGDGGSWGLVLNRRTELTFGELLDDLPFPASSEGPVFWGGPVEPSRMQVLHRLRREIPDELEIAPDLKLGIDADTFRDVVASTRMPGEALHAYVGHAGWAPGQLEAELGTGSWIVCTGDAAIVFDTNPDEIWDRVLHALGPSYARLVRVPADPRVN